VFSSTKLKIREDRFCLKVRGVDGERVTDGGRGEK
jgi:hypothetical protein